MKATSIILAALLSHAAYGAFIRPSHNAIRTRTSTSPCALFGGREEEKSWGVGGNETRSKENNDKPFPLEKINIPNPLAELADMFSNFDDVIDDFFNKRMGNGEIFYGKRKYKPSGSVESEYNGYGFSDFRKIEAAREFREERARKMQEMQERMAADKKERL
mmetsp:Transcript_5439/g.11139  ORF Transcript_5439/g.11139 Transcript_5439/m.11139 type:complete len:162 (+) Transcript_5439:40-525(+)